MILWEILGICGIAFIILEIFTPSMFFLNFAISAFICAIVSIFTTNIALLTCLFFILSFVSIIFLRPILLKKFTKDTISEIDDKYINKVVNTNSEIDGNKGEISIYGERWDARSDNGETIPAGSQVKILRVESIIMYVEKV